MRKQYLFVNNATVPKSTHYRALRRERALRSQQNVNPSTHVEHTSTSSNGLSFTSDTNLPSIYSSNGADFFYGERRDMDSVCKDGNFEADETHSQTRNGVSNVECSSINQNSGTDEVVTLGETAECIVLQNPIEFKVREETSKRAHYLLNNPLNMLTSTTDGDAMLMCLALGFRHSLPWVAIVDMLKMINVLFDRKVVKDTKYYLLKYTSHVRPKTTFHVYCPNCERYLGRKEEAKPEILTCKCGWKLKNINKAKNFFISLDLKSQLQELLKNPVFVNGLNYRFERQKINEHAYEDIFDGAVYREHFKPGGLLNEKYNMSYTFNTDGCSIGKSSRQTCWPIYVQISELAPHLRFKYTLLAGIYVGRKDPNMKMFLLPFVQEANQLSTVGIDWSKDGTNMNSKVIPLSSCLDSVARCKVVNMNQFNGKYGCTLCLETPRNTPSGLRFTVPVSNINERTHKDILRCAKKAFKNQLANKKDKTVVKGVKGPSPVHQMLYLDLVKGVRPDPMHNLFLGVSRSSTELLLKPQFRPNNASIFIGVESKQNCISTRLARISPPSVITRPPRSVKEASQWKASEWRSWLLFYGVVCLLGLVDDDYVTHFGMLATASHILLQKSILPEDLDKAYDLILKYVVDYQKHFGETSMVYNIHLLLHIKNSVQYLGPLWTHSAFGFEGENRYLLQMKKNHSSVAQEITTKYTTFKALPSLCESYASSDKAVEFCENLCDRPLKRYVRCGNAVLIGNGKFFSLADNPTETGCLVAQGYSDFNDVKSFDRMLYKGARYTIESYSDENKYDDSYICFQNRFRGRIQNILQIKCKNGEVHVSLIVNTLTISTDPVLDGALGRLCPIKKLVEYGSMIAIKPNEIKGQCVAMLLDNGNFICDVPYGCKGD